MGHEMVFGISTNEDVRAVFDKAVLEHEDDNGHNHSVSHYYAPTVKRLPKMTRQQARDTMEEHWHTRDHHRYDSVAAPLYAEDTLKRRKVTTKVTMTGEQWDNYGQRFALLKEAARAIPLREGEFVEYHSVVIKEGTQSADIATTTKVVQTPTKGKAVTRYFTHYAGNNPLAKGWDSGFASQAEARAAIVKHLEKAIAAGHTENVTFEVTPITRRENGEPMVSVSLVTSKVVAKLVVTVTKSTNPEKSGGWAIGTDCHH